MLAKKVLFGLTILFATMIVFYAEMTQAIPFFLLVYLLKKEIWDKRELTAVGLVLSIFMLIINLVDMADVSWLDVVFWLTVTVIYFINRPIKGNHAKAK